MFINGLSAALSGLQRQSSNFDRAADLVSRAGLRDVESGLDVPGGVGGAAVDVAPRSAGGATAGDSLTTGMINMMLAQRMFTASVRVAQTSDEMARDAISLGDRP